MVQIREVHGEAPEKPRSGRTPTIRVVILCLLLLLAGLRVAHYWRYTQVPWVTNNDFSPDYASAKEWRSGGDPYAPLAELYEDHLPRGSDSGSFEGDQLNPHPPFLILVVAPLSALDVTGARIALLFLMLGALIAAIYLFCRELGMATWLAVAVTAGVVALPVVENDIRWAQNNALVLLGLVLGWKALRRGNETGAGIAFGLATALKMYPWLMLIPLLRGRRFRAAGSMIGTVAIAFAIGMVAMGPSRTWHFLGTATDRNFEAWASAPQSISLVTLPFRIFLPDRWFAPAVVVPAWLVVMGGLAAALCVVAATRALGRISGDAVWSVMPWMILASPIAWPHYLVAMIPFGILIAQGLRRHREGAMRTLLGASLAVLALAAGLTEWIDDVIGHEPSYADVGIASTFLLGALVLLAVTDLGSTGGSRGSEANEFMPLHPGKVSEPIAR